MVVDTRLLLNRALDDGKTVLFEGAQATMLDVDHGTYPFVTSSNPIAGGVCTGSGIGPTRIDRVIGVIKAYTTRVGAGPVPDRAARRRTASGCARSAASSASRTGRNRRCGWYDAVIARYAARINGLTEFFLTKLDVLGAWERIPVCVAYEIDGVRHDEMPMTQTEFHHAKPVYEFFDGWQEDISGCRNFDDLPKNAQVYVRALEEMSGAPFWAVGVGPGREQTIVLRRRRRDAGPGHRQRAAASTPWPGARPATRGSTEVHAAPGNPGIAGVADAARGGPARRGRGRRPWPSELGADLVVVGPEAPLVAGVADAVRAARHRLLRPVRARPPGSRAPRPSPRR